MDTNKTNSTEMDRRAFIKAGSIATAAGAGVITASKTLARELPKGDSDDLNVAFIGVGAQGQQLLTSCLPIPGIRYRAICDVWSYHQRIVSRRLKAYNHNVNIYEDYQEMLAQEKDLDAVVVATPDWMHAEHANACMDAGLDVYCEKEMSNSLDKAKSMVLKARETGKLLQIGHQRRSNPRYRHAVETVILKEKLLGRVTQAYGQWNRAKSDDLGWAKGYEIDQPTLDKYGYETMSQFRNWRWYKKYGGGPIVDLGSHQIDIFAWVFGCNPRSVIASGGLDYYDNHDWYDTVMTIFEYENEFGVNRAMYQVLTTSSSGGFHEKFMGVDGTLEISEVPTRGNTLAKEKAADDATWEDAVRRGIINAKQLNIAPVQTKNIAKDVRASAPLGKYPLPIELFEQAHTPHLRNFFDAIRYGKKLNCPPEIGYETAVAVLKVNEAVEAQRRLEFKHEDFEV